MERYFHICHDQGTFSSGNLVPGGTVELTHPFRGPSSPPSEDIDYWRDLETRVNGELPEGVSFWGNKIYLGQIDDEFMGRREVVGEELRARYFPHRLSRMQAFFCCESVEDASRYRDGFNRPDAQIWEVEHDGRFERLDFSWMGRCPEDEMTRNLVSYWRGDATASPNWEILLRPPVHVIRLVATE